MIQATRHSDGRVGLDLLPELHYGKTEQKWIPSDGAFQLASSKRKKVFQHMQLHVDLSAGQMLVLTCRPDHPGSIGHYFFTEPVADEQLAQRLVIIRLARAGADPSFSEIVSAEMDPATGQPVARQPQSDADPLPGEMFGQQLAGWRADRSLHCRAEAARSDSSWPAEPSFWFLAVMYSA